MKITQFAVFSLFLALGMNGRRMHAQTMPAGQLPKQIVTKKATVKATVPAPPVAAGAGPQRTIEAATAAASAAATASAADAIASAAKATSDAINSSASTPLAVKLAAARQADKSKTDAANADNESKEAQNAATENVDVIDAANNADVNRNDAATDFAAEFGISEHIVDGKFKGAKCAINGVDSKGNPTYIFNSLLFPIWGPSCAKNSGAGFQSYFGTNNFATVGSKASYLYNAKLSTNEVNVQLLTATFPGFQAILAGTATAPQSTTNAGGTAATQSTQQVNSVSSALTNLQAGGDFNLSFPAPLLNHIWANGGVQLLVAPNVGMTINGLTTQTTSTESTQYNFNSASEVYGTFGSYDSTNSVKNAAFYVDVKGGYEVVSSAFKNATGLASPHFWIGQATLGIQFQNSIQIGFQYFVGPSGIYTVPNASGTGTTPVTSSLGGIHLVVSYSRPTT